MEYSQINALSKRGTNDYELWELTMPREKIHEIRQVPETVSGNLRQIIEGISPADEQPEGTFQFVLPHEDGLRLVPVDMGTEFTNRNRYNGTSVRGSREEIIAELRENLKTQGYSLRPNAAFVDVDVIATMQKIMEHNTDFYQTDFKYDMETLREVAEDRGGYRNFFWLTRKNGTWCFPERDAYIRNTYAANTWTYYGGSRDENVKAFWIDIKRVEGDDKKLIGDIVEMDYQKHLDYLCMAIPPRWQTTSMWTRIGSHRQCGLCWRISGSIRSFPMTCGVTIKVQNRRRLTERSLNADGKERKTACLTRCNLVE